MSKLRRFLLKKLTPKGGALVVIDKDNIHEDGPNWGRYYIETGDGLRIYIEDNEYVGFSTQSPYRE